MNWYPITLHRLAFVFAAVFASETSLAQIQILAPTAGTTWNAGDEVNVTWSIGADTHPNAGVRIVLTDGADAPGVMIGFGSSRNAFAYLAGDGNAAFRVPEHLGDGTNYVLRVEAFGRSISSLHEDSVENLTITGSSAIRRLEITSPEPEDTWTAGTEVNVEWLATGDPMAVSLNMSDNNGKLLIIENGGILSTGQSSSFMLPADIGDGTYSFAISQTGTIPAPDRRPMSFHVVDGINVVQSQPAPFVELLTPNGGEVLTAGEPFEVCWAASALADARVLFIASPLGSIKSYFIGAQSVSGGGCMTWTPCAFLDEDNLQMDLQLTTPDGLRLSDQSDATFSVQAITAAPTVTINSPANGSTHTQGNLSTVAWTEQGESDAISVAVLSPTTPDGDFRVNAVFRRDPNDPTILDWTVCPWEDVNDYELAVCQYASGCPVICDSIDVSIEPLVSNSTISVENPVEGDLWRERTVRTINWAGANLDGLSARLLLSSRDSLLGSLITVVDATNEQFDWTVIPLAGVDSSYRIVIELFDETCTIARARSDFFAVERLECPCGDANEDKLVDLLDFEIMRNCWGVNTTIYDWCHCSDIDNDGSVRLSDFASYQNHFGSAPDCE